MGRLRRIRNQAFIGCIWLGAMGCQASFGTKFFTPRRDPTSPCPFRRLRDELLDPWWSFWGSRGGIVGRFGGLGVTRGVHFGILGRPWASILGIWRHPWARLARSRRQGSPPQICAAPKGCKIQLKSLKHHLKSRSKCWLDF